MWRKAMEAQFFVHLRKYLFPPAVLALKHAMEGGLFWFEKPLIVDSLLQLLTLLCPAKIKRNELCDCIPLLFCWLLEQCDPTATESDFYQLVNLVDLNGEEKRYFNDPATAVNANSVPLVMREREKIPVSAIRHVDVRSFTRYMQNKTNYANITYCKCEDYLIYDPPKGTRVPVATISYLTDDQIKQLYETMARKYQSFTLITRGALRSDINDQLVLMQDRTVALIFSRKINERPKTSEPEFEVFHPLQYTVGRRQYVHPDDLYQLNKNGTQDRSLPEHLQLNVCEVPHTGSVHDPNVNVPIQQITVVALDISRSMFEKPASPDPNDPKTVLDMSIIMLGTMSDNIAFERCTHHVGLIHFGTSVEVICQITRNRNDFEKALSIQPESQEWTCMYDALNRATTLIRCYEQDNEKCIAPDCRRLIICISDGIDNHSSTTIEKLRDRLKKYDIVVDFISFLRDDLLKDSEKEKVSSFRKLCKTTHGYVYQNLPLTNIELGATFEQEAAVWLCERESKSYGFVDKPVRRMPAQLHQKATYKVPAQFAQSIQGTQNYHRVLREANNTIKAQIDNINVYVCRNDIYFWKIILSGPSKTPYEGGLWMLYVHFDSQYPRQPPKIRFVTEIYHVNVSADGRVCHHLFDRGWSNNTTMIEVFQSILQLLGEPNFEDAVSIEKAQLKREKPNEYDRQLKECTQRHGSKSLSQLKQDFELEDC
jgi:ubiquitin-protein ligase